jgi:hypothetical protein
MEAQYIVKAIDRLRPSSKYTFKEDDYSTIEWFEIEGAAPTAKQIQDAIAQIKVEETAKIQSDASAKAAILDRLGLTAEEAALLLS